MGAGQNLIVKPYVKITYKDPCGVADAGAMQNLYIIYPNNPAKTTNAITAGINQARSVGLSRNSPDGSPITVTVVLSVVLVTTVVVTRSIMTTLTVAISDKPPTSVAVKVCTNWVPIA
jgi:hypothetical protein